MDQQMDKIRNKNCFSLNVSHILQMLKIVELPSLVQKEFSRFNLPTVCLYNIWTWQTIKIAP